MFILTVRTSLLVKGKAMSPTCYNCVARTYSHPNSPFLASSHVPFRQRQIRASRVVYNEQLTKKHAAIAQFFLINNYVIYLITK